MRRMISVVSTIIILLLVSNVYSDDNKGFANYIAGVRHMRSNYWQSATVSFKKAISINAKDHHFTRRPKGRKIAYFPNRELGICYFNLGKFDLAEKALRKSLSQESTQRAQEYLDKVRRKDPPKLINRRTSKIIKAKDNSAKTNSDVISETSKELVGERLSLAVLNFDTQASRKIFGEIDPMDKMITLFVDQGRFRVMERTKIEAVLEEQKLGMTGIIDETTAAEIGKGIGVDLIVLGKVSRAATAATVDARVIDTETVEIVAAESEALKIDNVKNAPNILGRLVNKITKNFPILNGYVISAEDLMIDLGTKMGAKNGHKCIIFREGEEIIHPISGKTLGTKKTILGDIRLTEVYEEYAIGEIIGELSAPAEVGDFVISK